jgi:hypothetical protein
LEAQQLTPRQRGDFQTPEPLARLVWETLDATKFDLVIEPTFGKGSFLSTLPIGVRVPVFGWEIDQDYFHQTTAALSGHPHFDLMRIFLGDIFKIDSNDIPVDHSSRILIVGNPPWVTNSEQSALGGQNTGSKRNLKSLSGLAAKTGKANFDISEAIILHLVGIVKHAELAQFALLGKFTVLRNLIQFLSSEPNVGDFEFHRINALKHFGASVDAGLIKFKVGRSVKSRSVCSVFDSVGGKLECAVGLVNGRLVYDLPSYESNAFLERSTRPSYVWRQGVKHDLRDILELRQSDRSLVNRLGERVEIEQDALYYFYKSSDIFHGRGPRFLIPIYQRDLRDTLEDLPQRYPRLYSYLESHREAFASRKSSIYKNKSDFTMFGIGDYTHSPFKIAIGGFYSQPVFRLLAPSRYCSAVDDTSYTISINTYEEASYVHAVLNLDCTREFLLSISYPGDKRRFSKDVLDRAYVPPFDEVPANLRSNLSDSSALTEWVQNHGQQRLF